jgi:uncharacterized protein (DUF305 family)
MNHQPYMRLTAMTVLSFISMYVLMYAMAGLMAAAMVLIELLLMGAMYENKRLNVIIAGVSVVAAIAFFVLIRQQTAVTDRQFLRLMIPHHAGAILMCEKGPGSKSRDQRAVQGNHLEPRIRDQTDEVHVGALGTARRSFDWC